MVYPMTCSQSNASGLDPTELDEPTIYPDSTTKPQEINQEINLAQSNDLVRMS